jgi:nicotinamide riboside kinase
MNEAIRKIVISGPESTGKTSLARDLSRHFNGPYIPEYARGYIAELNRPYTYEDVVHVAETQVRLEREMLGKAGKFLFYDTYLIITKVWFKVVYGKYPDWLDDYLGNAGIDLFLLCYPDLPWIPDPVRENPGEMRIRLFRMYREEAGFFGFPVTVIKGSDQLRYLNAVKAVNNLS